MKRIYLFILFIGISFWTNNQAQAQACFSIASPGTSYAQTHQCNSFQATLVNCSAVTYDQAVWTLQINSSANCAGPWGTWVSQTFNAPVQANPFTPTINATGVYCVKLDLYLAGVLVATTTQCCIFQIFSKPAVNFTVAPSPICGGGQVVFTPIVSGGTPPSAGCQWNYNWNFGGGSPASSNTNSSSAATPQTVNYACRPLPYSATFIATDCNGCYDLAVLPVAVNAPCKPVAGFSISSGNPCTAPATLGFTASPSPPGYSYKWWFMPAGTPATGAPNHTGQIINHTFTSQACYDALLAITDNASGCVDTFRQSSAVCIQGFTASNLTASLSTMCNAQSVCCTLHIVNSSGQDLNSCFFTGTASPNSGSGVLATANFNNVGNGDYVACFSLSASASTVLYTISCGLITNSANGCTSTFAGTVGVTVKPSPIANINLSPGTASSYCAPAHNFCFNASQPVQNTSAIYEWYLNPSYSLPVAGNNPASFCQFFNGVGTKYVYLKVCLPAASGGCCAYTMDSVLLQKPVFTFVGDTLTGCGPITTNFTATNHSVPLDSIYKWYPCGYPSTGPACGPFITTTPFFTYTYPSFPDSCYSPVCILIRKAAGVPAFACTDTVKRTKFVKVGHKVTPYARLFPMNPCIEKKVACVTIIDSVPGYKFPAKAGICPSLICDWYFTRPHAKVPLIRSYNCDTPKLCFTDTGYYDAHYRFCVGGCCDTLVIDSAVVISGIIGAFTDSVHCTSAGQLSVGPPTVTFHTSYKIYPKPTSGKVYTQLVFPTIADPITGLPPYIIKDSLNYGTLANPLIPTFKTYNVSAFPQAGSYPVSYIVSYPGSQCPADTTQRTVTINSITAVPRLVPPTANYVICKNQSLTFSSGRSNPTRPDIVQWNFCENNTRYAPNPSNDTLITHQFDSCGFFCARLFVSNTSGSCKDSAQITGIKVVDMKPQFVLTGGTGCNPCLTLTNNTTYCFTTFDSIYINWNTYSTIPYSDTQRINTNFTSLTHCGMNIPYGGSQVYYEIFESQGHCMRSGYLNYNTNGVLADFTFSTDTLICAGVPVTLNSATAGNPSQSEFVWNTGSGICTTAPVPYNNTSLPNVGVTSFSQTYNSQGYYYVTLYAGNQYCKDSICKVIHVQNPVACFNLKRDTLNCPGVDTVFNCSYGAADSLILTFSCPNVSLPGFPPIPFSYTASYGKPFPSTLILPAKLPGVYQVCVSLISFGANCTDSMCRTLVVAGPVGLVTTQQNQSVCAGTPVNFVFYTNSFANPNIVFQDSLPKSIPYNSSNSYNFTHYFVGLGQQIIQIWIEDKAGCSYALYDTVLVDKPQAAFTYTASGLPGNNGSYCGPVTVAFTDMSTKTIYNIDPLSYRWTFYHGNGSVISTSTQINPTVTFFPPDTVSAKLQISSTFGCIDSFKTSAIVMMHQFPLASFTSSPDTLCLTQCLNFTNTSVNLDPNAGYTWYHDWTNHTPNTVGLNSSYCYTTAGSFKTVVIDSSIYGCVDTSASKTIVVLPDLDAMFTIANDSLCGFTSTAIFTSTSIPNTGVSYCWNFGDDVNGDSLICHSTIANPTHLYTLNPPGAAGSVFRVRLKIQSRYGCLDSTTHNVSIFPNPVAGIAALPTVSCDPLNINFTDASNSLNGIINYHLNYGLAGSVAYNSPAPIGGVAGQFVYTPAGNYTATYTVTTGEGCTSNTTIALVVNPNPVACPGPKDTICNGDLISIGCQPVPNLQYAWYRPIGPLYTPGNNVAQPVVHPALTTTYCLNVVNQFGCQDTDCVEIYVWPLVTIQAGPDSNICYGQPITLWANAVGPTIGNYQWHNINSVYTSTQQNITVNPLNNDVYTVSILGPCNSDSLQMNINVFQPPPVTLEPSATIVAGQPYSILTVGNGTGLWFPDYAISCVNCLNPIVSPEINTTYHVVLTDIHGCVDSATIFITVLCDRTNAVYVPNAFTPSKPGKNDHFYVQGTGVKEISYLRIYNRWGNLVFSTQHTQINKPELGWDGTFGGKELSSDVFMYQMQVECANGTLFPITGNFTLIR